MHAKKRGISALPVPHRFGVSIKLPRSRTELDPATRQTIKKLRETDTALEEYSDPKTERYQRMVEYIGDRLNFTS